jgi:hypothetical protein
MTDYTIDDVIFLPFTTRAFATGVPTAMAGSPTVEIYENASTTPIVEGAGKLVLTQGLNGIAGFHMATVTLSAANGFEAGKHYTLVVKTGTVGGTSIVGETVGEFTIAWSSAYVRLGAPAGASVSADILVIDNFVDGIESTLGTPAGASISADVAAVKVDTAAILVDTGTTLDGRIPAALVGGRMDSSTGAMAAGVVTAAAIATNAIDADALAADAVAEIADGVWDEDATAHQTTGTFGQAIGDPVADTNTIYKAVVTDAAGATVGVDVVAVQADTDNLQTRIPAALVSGRIDASVGAMEANVVTATAIAADAITDAKVAADVTIAAVTGAVGSVTAGVTLAASAIQAIWDALTSALTTAGSIGKRLVDNITGDAYVRLGAPAGASVSADILTLDNLVDDLESRLGSPSDLGSGATVAANLVDIEGQTDDIGVAGVGLTNLGGMSTTMKAQVQQEAEDALAVVVADSIPADGSRPSPNQALYAIYQFLMERSVSGTTLTVRKPDGSTSLMTFTLDSATAPTSITRTT